MANDIQGWSAVLWLANYITFISFSSSALKIYSYSMLKKGKKESSIIEFYILILRNELSLSCRTDLYYYLVIRN